ncbi:MAG: hypothetical protein ACTHQM_13110 [Thermoanaerobaculia bacterium]
MSEEKVQIFERPPVPKIFSVAATCASAAVFFMYLSEHPTDYEALPMILLLLLFLGTFGAAILQYGDHIYLSEEGVKYENRLFKVFGKQGQWMRWEDIIEVREVKERILILLSADGRRMLVDAIVGYAFARREILRRAPQAILSGTLARDDS